MDEKRSGVQPLTALVEEKIINIIKENNMKPGDKLENEYELAERLNVGRGTIREAIKSMVSRNILITRQGSGTFVSPRQGIPTDPLGLTFMKEKEGLALELLDVRLILEPEIAAISAIKSTQEDLDKIVEQCDKVERLILDGKDYGKEDVLLHRYIAEASKNQIIGNLVSIIHSSVPLSIGLTNNELKENTIIYHREVVKALQNRDPQGARYAMISHLGENRRYVQSYKKCGE